MRARKEFDPPQTMHQAVGTLTLLDGRFREQTHSKLLRSHALEAKFVLVFHNGGEMSGSESVNVPSMVGDCLVARVFVWLKVYFRRVF